MISQILVVSDNSNFVLVSGSKRTLIGHAAFALDELALYGH
jgi:hypothetical protein